MNNRMQNHNARTSIPIPSNERARWRAESWMVEVQQPQLSWMLVERIGENGKLLLRLLQAIAKQQVLFIFYLIIQSPLKSPVVQRRYIPPQQQQVVAPFVQVVESPTACRSKVPSTLGLKSRQGEWQNRLKRSIMVELAVMKANMSRPAWELERESPIQALRLTVAGKEPSTACRQESTWKNMVSLLLLTTPPQKTKLQLQQFWQKQSKQTGCRCMKRSSLSVWEAILKV